jgi:hypothetical protein
MEESGGGDVGPDWVVARYFYGHDVTSHGRLDTIRCITLSGDICQQ